MSLDLYARFVIALVAVLALVLLCAWLARRFGLAGRGFGVRGQRRLSIVEVAPVDGKRRLVLLRRDDTEHLVLVGVDNAIVIESGITAPPSGTGFAAMVEETRS
jgi:flagellar protein FliO/FliZ